MNSSEIPYSLFWIRLEVDYFFAWIFGIAMFMLACNRSKLRAIWKSDFDEKDFDENKDLWNQKNSDDFLHYFKTEAFAFGLFLGNIWMNVFEMFFKGAKDVESTTLQIVLWYLYLHNLRISINWHNLSREKVIKNKEKLKKLYRD